MHLQACYKVPPKTGSGEGRREGCDDKGVRRAGRDEFVGEESVTKMCVLVWEGQKGRIGMQEECSYTNVVT